MNFPTMYRYAAMTLLGLLTVPVTANGQFTEVEVTLPGVDVSSVAWGDFNKDGLPDILITGMNAMFQPVAVVFQNNGDGTFTEIDSGLSAVAFSSVAVGDYNNNGLPDILLTGRGADFGLVSKVYRNNGDNTFTDIEAGLTPVQGGGVAWADFNGNGLRDIVLTGLNAQFNPVAAVYQNNGDGTFTATGAGLVPVAYSSVAVGDMNGNGMPDIVLAGENAHFQVVAKVYENNGDGTFSDAGADLTGVFFGSLALADFDDDGRLDILITGWDADFEPVTRLYRNLGNGAFAPVDAGLTPVGDSSVAWGNFDSDGHPDILLTGWDGSGPVAKLYRNNGNGTFSEVDTTLAAVSNSSVAWSDFDGDGSLDVLLTGFDGFTVISRLYRNEFDQLSKPEPPAESVEEIIARMMQYVDDLRGARKINNGIANAATVHLRNVLRSYQGDKMAPACNQLGGFVNHIQGQINARRLGAPDAEPLFEDAHLLRSLLACP